MLIRIQVNGNETTKLARIIEEIETNVKISCRTKN